MALIPEDVQTAFQDREGPIVLATVNPFGTPNVIYATCVSLYDAERLVIADNYFKKTRANIRSGSLGAILFITKEGKAYQVKGKIEYHQEGEIFQDMKSWNPKKHPGHAAAVLKVQEVYSGAERLV